MSVTLNRVSIDITDLRLHRVLARCIRRSVRFLASGSMLSGRKDQTAISVITVRNVDATHAAGQRILPRNALLAYHDRPSPAFCCLLGRMLHFRHLWVFALNSTVCLL